MNNSLMILLLLGSAPGQQPTTPPVDTKAEADEAGAIAKKMVGEYVFRPEKSSGKSLKLETEPVLRWTNHLGRRFYGDVYVWTHEGRPEVVASVNKMRYRSPTRSNENG